MYVQPPYMLAPDLLFGDHHSSSLHTYISAVLSYRRWLFHVCLCHRVLTQQPHCTPSTPIGEKPIATEEPPLPGGHVLDEYVLCIYFPEIFSLFILSKLRFQGIPKCFFFQIYACGQAAAAFWRSTQSVCLLPGKMTTTMMSIPSVLVNFLVQLLILALISSGTCRNCLKLQGYKQIQA